MIRWVKGLFRKPFNEEAYRASLLNIYGISSIAILKKDDRYITEVTMFNGLKISAISNSTESSMRCALKAMRSSLPPAVELNNGKSYEYRIVKSAGKFSIRRIEKTGCSMAEVGEIVIEDPDFFSLMQRTMMVMDSLRHDVIQWRAICER